MLRQLRKTAGSPESGLPASNINAADGYENQLSATAEMINTSSARGTAAFTLCSVVLRSLRRLAKFSKASSLLLLVVTSARLLPAVGPLPFYGVKMNLRCMR